MNRLFTCLLAALLVTPGIPVATATASDIEYRENPEESPGAASRNNSPTEDQKNQIGRAHV